MSNLNIVSLLTGNNSYVVLFSTSKAPETAGSVANGTNNSNTVAYGGETAGSVASSYTGGSTSCGSSCGSFTAIA